MTFTQGRVTTTARYGQFFTSVHLSESSVSLLRGLSAIAYWEPVQGHVPITVNVGEIEVLGHEAVWKTVNGTGLKSADNQ